MLLSVDRYYVPLLHFGSIEERLDDATIDGGSATTSILFTGDVFLGRDVERIGRQWGFSYHLDLFNQFAESDAIVINFESAIPQTHVPVPSMGMRFSVLPEAVIALKNAGITHASLANNHTYDYDADGYSNTESTLLENDITTFGHPTAVNNDSVSTIDTAYGEVALIGIHTLFTSFSAGEIKAILDKQTPDRQFTIAYVHWGEEYQLYPSNTQRTFAQELVEEVGVDMIIGHHPHVVQTVESIQEVPVVYSLGNTIFDQYFSNAVQDGLLLEMQFTAESIQAKLHPISSQGSRTRPYLMPANERSEFLESIAERSGDEYSESIKGGTLPLLR